MLRAATGWDMTLDEFLQVGERRINMMRAFNAREGLTRENDTLKKKFFKPLQGTGPNAGVHYTPRAIRAHEGCLLQLCRLGSGYRQSHAGEACRPRSGMD